MIEVINKAVITIPNAVVVDRTTMWGNPYRLEDYHNDRTKVLELYEAYLVRQLTRGGAFYRHFMQLVARDTLVLACWCKPLPCHGDILAYYIEQARRK